MVVGLGGGPLHARFVSDLRRRLALHVVVLLALIVVVRRVVLAATRLLRAVIIGGSPAARSIGLIGLGIGSGAGS